MIDVERLSKDYRHMKEEIDFAIQLLTEPDAPNRINREERVEFALERLQMAQRYANGAPERECWTS